MSNIYDKDSIVALAPLHLIHLMTGIYAYDTIYTIQI